MTKTLFSSLAFATALGMSTVAVFAGTLSDSATPLRANSNKVTFYSSGSIAAAIGFQKDMFESAVDVGLSDIDPRLVKSEDIAYAVVDRKTALEMIKNVRDEIGRADKGTKLVDTDGYAVVMLDAETMRAESAYAELVDDEITDDTVLILVVGAGAAQTLRGLGIEEDKLVIDAADIFDMFRQYTLGLGGDMPEPDTGMLGAAAPELADS